MSTRTRAVLLALAVLLGVAPVSRAAAQAPPEAEPVLEIVAPVLSPVCGNALLAVALAPGLVGAQLGMPLPVDIATAAGPVVIVCGAVPAPSQTLKCDPDATIRSTVDTVAGAVAGTALPLDTSVVAPVVGSVIVLEDNLPAPANTAGLADTAMTTLTCSAIVAPATEEAPPEEAVATEPAAEPEPILEVLPGFEELTDLPPIDVPIEEGEDALAQLGSAVAPPELTAVGSTGFAYPVVFALPLVLLILGGYLGRMLTRPVAAPAKPSA